MMIKSVSKNKGSILVEAMVAMAIFAIGMSFVLLLFVSSSKGALLSLEGTKASLMDTQAMEAVRSVFNDRGWLPVGTYEVGVKDNKEWDIISTDGLVGHWELSGDADDYSGNDNHGTLVGGVTWAEDRMGQARGAAEFDGVGGYVDCGNDESLNITDAITIGAWIYPLEKNETYRTILSKGYFSTENYQLRMDRTSSGNHVSFEIGIGSGICSSPLISINNNQWYHVVGYFDGDKVGIFINGENKGSILCSAGIAILNNDNLTIGKNISGYKEYWKGLIDDVRVYNRALSAEEIKALYGHYSDKYQSSVTVGDGVTDGLVGYWPMNEGEGNYVYDYSPRTDNWGKMFGPYLDFDGENDYVDCGNDASLNFGSSGDFTVEFWFQLLSYPGGYKDFIGTYSGIGYEIGFASSTGNLRFLIKGDGGKVDVSDPNSIELNRWYHIALTADRDGLAEYYRDNVSIASTAMGAEGNIGTSNSFRINNINGDYVNFLIDDVRIYNRALSASEIQEHYNGIHKDETGLVGHWDMDEGYGGQVRDKSGNGNHGTINGATWGDNSPEWVDDVSGGALEFDGVDDYVDCGNDSSLNFGSGVDITISTWFRWRGSSNSEVILSKGDGAEADGWTLRDGWGEDSRILFRNNHVVLSAGSGWADNNWHFITVVIDRDGMSYLYIDGEIMDSIDSSEFGTFSNNKPFRMGRKPNGEYFNGLMSDVRIYNRALSADEIQKIYEYGRTNKFYTSE